MREAAEALRLTAQDLKKLTVCDEIIPEPLGGAHRDRATTIESVRAAVTKMLGDLGGKSSSQLVKDRRKKFLGLGNQGLSA